jgi:hypothetical protein
MTVPIVLLASSLACILLCIVLVVVGVLAIVGHIPGGAGGGIGTILFALLPLYPAFLFGRASRRIRLRLSSVQGRARQRSTLKAVGAYVATLIAFDVFTPLPGVLKVVGSATALVLFPVILATELEPTK